jgi:predicted phage baseplate assembly protein
MTDTLRWADLAMMGDRRREEIRRAHHNGLDGVEVRRHGRRLVLTFLQRPPHNISAANILIEGPPGAPLVRVEDVRLGTEEDADLQQHLLVDLQRAGGQGQYRLALVEQGPHAGPGRAPLAGIDPLYAQAQFSFVPAVAPAAGLSAGSAPAPGPEADISYLGRDYEGFRQLMLDRLATTLPSWTERHVPDIAVMLAELLAYVGDDLSYLQDAVATEAYLQTARLRVSVRRHGRLVGYRLHEGAGARVWIALEVAADLLVPLSQVGFVAATSQVGEPNAVLDLAALAATAAASAPRFLPLHPGAGLASPSLADPSQTHPGTALAAHASHNRIELWTWGEDDAWLAVGATRAVLVDGWAAAPDDDTGRPRLLKLRPGDVIILEEIHDWSGAGLADTSHRHPVRLTQVREDIDDLYNQPVLLVTWSEQDGLPFPLRIAAPGAGGQPIACAVARGNVVLAAHGQVITETLDLTKPILSTPQLSFSAPFPEPGVVARNQAHRLRRLNHHWAELVERWWRSARAGVPLTSAQLSALDSQFGQPALGELGISSDSDSDTLAAERAERQGAGLRQLLQQADRLLARRVARLEELARIVESSGPLSGLLLGEVAADWGSQLAAGLDPHDPHLWGPATAATATDARMALPVIELSDLPEAGAPANPTPRVWTPLLDLLDDDPSQPNLVVEVYDDGAGHLRFDPAAPLPASGQVQARYQVGNGVGGNLPAELINVLVWTGDPASPDRVALDAVRVVRNPLPALGGVDPESIDAAKKAIPGASLLAQPRALDAPDYAAAAGQTPGVARAAAQLTWGGSRVVVQVAVQPARGEAPRQRLLDDVANRLAPVRRIGHDISVAGPRYRSLFLALAVQLETWAIRSDVADSLGQLLGNQWRADGSPALFNPSRLGFGQPVQASAIIAAVQLLPGIQMVSIEGFALDRPEPGSAPAIGSRVVPGPLDIIRLDNDPQHPAHGRATVRLQGGR